MYYEEKLFALFCDLTDNIVEDAISDRVKEAFKKANSIVFELDLHNPSTVETLMQCKNMPNGDDVSHYLPAKLYARLKHYIRKYRQRLASWSNRVGDNKIEARKRARHIYNSVAGGWEQRRPVWLLFLLYQLSEKFAQREHIPMLDLYLAQYAIETNKRLLSIETPTEQCNPLSSIDREQLLFAINYTLSYLEFEQDRLSKRTIEDGSTGLPDLIYHYNCGSLEASIFNLDAKRFNHLGFSLSPELDRKAQQIDLQLREDIIVKRNVRMAKRIAALLRQADSNHYFFALGAGHFLGENSVLDLLETHGFTIQPVTEKDHISFPQLDDKRFQKFTELWIREIPHARDPTIDISVSVIELSSAPSVCHCASRQNVLLIICLLISLARWPGK
ncbi:Metalloprotease TIKI -like protein [Toxocara canis]|uniref:Metalloprotease TIKI homolog n=1 Tax=Toxocara canis TaxID=6265 RepID=A0A0B2VLA6_TOXCA|nr:Metalloprotease TIKI -like protein [Toxocara canis]